MLTLSAGGNTNLGDVAMVGLGVRWSPVRLGDVDIDMSAFVVGKDGKVRGDDDFIFYNNLEGCGGAIRLGGERGKNTLVMNLDNLPADVDRIAVTLSIDGKRSFADVESVDVIVPQVCSFQPTTKGMKEAALILVEIYRRGDGWKLRAVGQGFNGGLAPLALHFGVDVAGDAAAPPPLPARLAASSPPPLPPPARPHSSPPPLPPPLPPPPPRPSPRPRSPVPPPTTPADAPGLLQAPAMPAPPPPAAPPPPTVAHAFADAGPDTEAKPRVASVRTNPGVGDASGEAPAERVEAVRRALCQPASYERQRIEKSNELVLHAFEGRANRDRRVLVGDREFAGAPTDPVQIAERGESGLPVLQLTDELDPMTIVCVCYFAPRGGR